MECAAAITSLSRIEHAQPKRKTYRVCDWAALDGIGFMPVSANCPTTSL
jgi:hypothetical protein